MKEKPILFSGPMVRAILEGRKTVTRRVVKPQPPAHWNRCEPVSNSAGAIIAWDFFNANDPTDHGYHGTGCPYGQPGDRLWVRETWQAIHVSIDPETGYGDDVRAADKIPSDSQHGYWGVAYAATDPQANEHRDDRGFVWRPGIHMPRWASRITLEIVSVRVERLQDISEADAVAEGCDEEFGHTADCNDDFCALNGDMNSCVGNLTTARDNYRALWESINGPGSWGANPWVWRVEFKRVEVED